MNVGHLLMPNKGDPFMPQSHISICLDTLVNAPTSFSILEGIRPSSFMLGTKSIDSQSLHLRENI